MNATLKDIVKGYFDGKDLKELVIKAKQKGCEDLKNGKNPTRVQKDFMGTLKLDYRDWLVVKDTADTMVVVHRGTGTIKSYAK